MICSNRIKYRFTGEYSSPHQSKGWNNQLKYATNSSCLWIFIVSIQPQIPFDKSALQSLLRHIHRIHFQSSQSFCFPFCRPNCQRQTGLHTYFRSVCTIELNRSLLDNLIVILVVSIRVTSVAEICVSRGEVTFKTWQ